MRIFAVFPQTEKTIWRSTNAFLVCPPCLECCVRLAVPVLLLWFQLVLGWCVRLLNLVLSRLSLRWSGFPMSATVWDIPWCTFIVCDGWRKGERCTLFFLLQRYLTETKTDYLTSTPCTKVQILRLATLVQLFPRTGRGQCFFATNAEKGQPGSARVGKVQPGRGFSETVWSSYGFWWFVWDLGAASMTLKAQKQFEEQQRELEFLREAGLELVSEMVMWCMCSFQCFSQPRGAEAFRATTIRSHKARKGCGGFGFWVTAKLMEFARWKIRSLEVQLEFMEIASNGAVRRRPNKIVLWQLRPGTQHACTNQTKWCLIVSYHEFIAPNYMNTTSCYGKLYPGRDGWLSVFGQLRFWRLRNNLQFNRKNWRLYARCSMDQWLL